MKSIHHLASSAPSKPPRSSFARHHCTLGVVSDVLLLIIMNTIEKNSGIERLTIKGKGNNTVAHVANVSEQQGIREDLMSCR